MSKFVSNVNLLVALKEIGFAVVNARLKRLGKDSWDKQTLLVPISWSVDQINQYLEGMFSYREYAGYSLVYPKEPIARNDSIDEIHHLEFHLSHPSINHLFPLDVYFIRDPERYRSDLLAWGFIIEGQNNRIKQRPK